MGLTTVAVPVAAPTDTTTTAVPDKTIAISFYGSAGTLVFSVPAGRKFIGYFHARHGSYDAGYIVASGGTFTNNTNGTYSAQCTWPPYSEQYVNGTPVLTLHSGDKLYSSPYSNSLVRVTGVESDA